MPFASSTFYVESIHISRERPGDRLDVAGVAMALLAGVIVHGALSMRDAVYGEPAGVGPDHRQRPDVSIDVPSDLDLHALPICHPHPLETELMFCLA